MMKNEKIAHAEAVSAAETTKVWESFVLGIIAGVVGSRVPYVEKSCQ